MSEESTLRKHTAIALAYFTSQTSRKASEEMFTHPKPFFLNLLSESSSTVTPSTLVSPGPLFHSSPSPPIHVCSPATSLLSSRPTGPAARNRPLSECLPDPSEVPRPKLIFPSPHPHLPARKGLLSTPGSAQGIRVAALTLKSEHFHGTSDELRCGHQATLRRLELLQKEQGPPFASSSPIPHPGTCWLL